MWESGYETHVSEWAIRQLKIYLNKWILYELSYNVQQITMNLNSVKDSKFLLLAAYISVFETHLP
jgi:hypothetical protein